MAKSYDKDFLVTVYLSRFINGLPNLDVNNLCVLEANANKLYDKVGKERFRDYASVTPEEIRKFNATV